MVHTNDATKPRVVLPIIATAALLTCAVLGPIQSRIWNGPRAPAVAQAVAALVAPCALLEVPASTQPTPPAPYFAFGHAVIAVYLALLLLVRSSGLADTPRLQRLAQHALTVAAVGNVLAYWASQALGPTVRDLGFFGLEVPALLVVLGVMAASGVIGLRCHDVASVAALGLVLPLPLALVATAALQYLPHGVLGALAAGFLINAFGRAFARAAPVAEVVS